MSSKTTGTVYRAAVVGLGFVGAGDQVSGDALGQQVANLDGTHVGAFSGHPRVRLVAGSSRDPGRRRRFTERTGISNTYAEWSRMLQRERPDIVGVATYSPVHAEITIACFEAGTRAVLCEKPVATRLRDADRMIEAARSHDALLAVNHNRRWHPLWRSVREAIGSGAAGTVQNVMVQWSSGRLANVGTHLFDAVAMALDAEPTAVSGRLDPVVPPDCRGADFRDPGGWGTVLFSNGVRLFVDAEHTGCTPLRFVVSGTRGQIEVHGADAEVRPWQGEPQAVTSPSGHRNSMALAVDELVNSLDHGGVTCSSGKHARAALEVIVGFHVSHRAGGRWVDLPLQGADRDVELLTG